MANTLPITVLGCTALLLGASTLPAKPAFQELLFNPQWYRTFEAKSSIAPAEGTLLFAWDFADPEKRPDSFFVGIDTLWGLPQNLDGDTASDWDLQVCPDEICMNGLKAGIHGANSPYPFDGSAKIRAEHHFQFFPAIDKDFNFTAPARSLFGGMMFCRSRSTGVSDTVLAFGAWNLKWDPAFAPPVRPVEGALPRRSDFAIEGDTVRYRKTGAGIGPLHHSSFAPHRIGLIAQSSGLRVELPRVGREMQVKVIDSQGRILWQADRISAGQAEVFWNRKGGTGTGVAIVRATWKGGSAQALFVSPAR